MGVEFVANYQFVFFPPVGEALNVLLLPGDYVDPFGCHQCTLAVSTNVPWETPKMMLVWYVLNFVVVVVI